MFAEIFIVLSDLTGKTERVRNHDKFLWEWKTQENPILKVWGGYD